MTKLNSDQTKAVAKRLARGESLRAIARDMGVSYQSLQYHRRRAGAAPLRAARTTGEAHASWRGGSFVDRWGYRMVRAPERGRANPYVPEHVLAAEENLGRLLQPGEVVHHIDGNKLNNKPPNLHVCRRAEHRRLHAQLESLAYGLMRTPGRICWTGDGYEIDRVR